MLNIPLRIIQFKTNIDDNGINKKGLNPVHFLLKKVILKNR